MKIVEKIDEIVVEEKRNLYLEITILDYEKQRFTSTTIQPNQAERLLETLKTYLRKEYAKQIEYYKKKVNTATNEEDKKYCSEKLIEYETKLKQVE